MLFTFQWFPCWSFLCWPQHIWGVSRWSPMKFHKYSLSFLSCCWMSALAASPAHCKPLCLQYSHHSYKMHYSGNPNTREVRYSIWLPDHSKTRHFCQIFKCSKAGQFYTKEKYCYNLIIIWEKYDILYIMLIVVSCC